MNAHKGGKFTGIWIQAEIVREESIHGTEKMFLAEIVFLAKRPAGCTASNQYLGKLFQLSPRQVQRYVASLVRKGWITNEPIGRSRRRLRSTEKLRRLIDLDGAHERQARHSSERRNCHPLKEINNTKKTSLERSPSSDPVVQIEKAEPEPNQKDNEHRRQMKEKVESLVNELSAKKSLPGKVQTEQQTGTRSRLG